MRLPEYDQWDASEMAERVRSGDVSPKELVDAAVERVEARNPAINAVVQTWFEEARRDAPDAPDGPFRGVPFLVKDLVMNVQNKHTTSSSRSLAGYIAASDSELMKRYRAAGLVTLGKTNTSEFGILAITEPELRGPCRNPWNLDHTPGGSSGGSAAAVAARIVPIAHGGDGGGSIRIPAAACGLVGLKPTRGRVPFGPEAGERWSGFVQQHVLTRTVRDCAAVLDATDATDPGAPYRAPPKRRAWTSYLEKPPKKLKIAFSSEPLFGTTVAPECVAALEQTMTHLESLGHRVEEARPRFDRDALVHAYFLTVGANVAAGIAATEALTGQAPRPSDFEAPTWFLGQLGSSTSAGELIAARALCDGTTRTVEGFLEDFDHFVTPTMAFPPVKIGEIGPTRVERFGLGMIRAMPAKAAIQAVLDGLGKDALSRTPNTMLFNQSGHPAISLPLHWTPDGMPIGIQFVGRFGDEGGLFKLAAQLEQAVPWADRTPPLIA